MNQQDLSVRPTTGDLFNYMDRVSPDDQPLSAAQTELMEEYIVMMGGHLDGENFYIPVNGQK